MLKGSYQIIDLKGRKLEIGVGSVYEGIYDLIKSTNKNIIVSGLNVEGIDIRDDFATVKVDGTNFDLIVGNYLVTITDRDIVKVTYHEKRFSSFYDSEQLVWNCETDKDTMKNIAWSEKCFPLYIAKGNIYAICCSREDDYIDTILTFLISYGGGNLYIHKVFINRVSGYTTINEYSIQ